MKYRCGCSPKKVTQSLVIRFLFFLIEVTRLVISCFSVLHRPLSEESSSDAVWFWLRDTHFPLLGFSVDGVCVSVDGALFLVCSATVAITGHAVLISSSLYSKQNACCCCPKHIIFCAEKHFPEEEVPGLDV